MNIPERRRFNSHLGNCCLHAAFQVFFRFFTGSLAKGIEHHDEAVPVAVANQFVQLLPLSRLVPREVELVDIIADGFEEHARHQHEDFVLALEIVVDQPGRHVGALRDVLDGGGFVGTLFQHAAT